MKSHKTRETIKNIVVYAILIFFAAIMLFPFLFMLTTSFKEPKDTFNYPPRLLPRTGLTTETEGEELPLYSLTDAAGVEKVYALVESNIRINIYANLANPEETFERQQTEAKPKGGFVNQEKVMLDGEEKPVFLIQTDAGELEVVEVGRTALGRFVNPDNPEDEVLANVRLSQPVEKITARPQNYRDVVELQGLDRSLTNTILVTLLVVLGTLTTSVLGGYAFARLRFPGRNNLFVLYLGTMMIPFVVLVTPMYQLMVYIGWVNNMVAFIVP